MKLRYFKKHLVKIILVTIFLISCIRIMRRSRKKSYFYCSTSSKNGSSFFGLFVTSRFVDVQLARLLARRLRS